MGSPSAVSAEEQVSHVPLFHSLLISTQHKGNKSETEVGVAAHILSASIIF